MRRKLIIDGNAVYEIDDECVCRKEARREQMRERQETASQARTNPSGAHAAKRNNPSCTDPDRIENGPDIHFCEQE